MLAGHLREKNGYYHMIINYKDSDGKRKTKSISTGLTIKGNKKRAEAMLLEMRKNFKPEDVITGRDTPMHILLEQWIKNKAKSFNDETLAVYNHNIRFFIRPYFENNTTKVCELSSTIIERFYNHVKSEHHATKKIILQLHEILTITIDYAVELGWIDSNPTKNINPATDEVSILFTDFMLDWLEMMRSRIEPTTFASYNSVINKSIIPYFKEKAYTLKEMEENPKYIQDYYQHGLNSGLSPNTVIRRHANVRKALQHAFQLDLIKSNPADKIERPKQEKFNASYYTEEELIKLFEVSKGDPMELAIILAGFYGLRRSEVLGLKWDAIDFKAKKISIHYTVTETNIGDGRGNIVLERKGTKTKSSMRILHLVKPVEDLLINMKKEQAENRRLCGSSYNEKYIEFINVNKMGDRLKPGYLTQHFSILLKNNGLRKIRFHDLRHTCASLLYKKGRGLKEIQEWLGHSDISTTSDIYTHLGHSSKVSSANAIVGVLEHIQEELES